MSKEYCGVYAKGGSPRSTSSMKRWKGILMYSDKQNGVTMAVFGMSSGFTGIWWNALNRLRLENIALPVCCDEKSWMFGMGYLSITVFAFNDL